MVLTSYSKCYSSTHFICHVLFLEMNQHHCSLASLLSSSCFGLFLLFGKSILCLSDIGKLHVLCLWTSNSWSQRPILSRCLSIMYVVSVCLTACAPHESRVRDTSSALLQIWHKCSLILKAKLRIQINLYQYCAI